MKVLVVTGGIGSGKSVAGRIINELYGFPVYDADARVKALYVKCPSLLDSIENILGICLRDEDQTFNPSKLAQVIFSDSAALQTVEALVFPELKADFERFKAENIDAGAVVFESATVLEKPCFEGFGDMILYIDAPYELRLRRACERGNISRELVEARMRKQPGMNDGSAMTKADAVIVNDGSIESLMIEIQKIINSIN